MVRAVLRPIALLALSAGLGAAATAEPALVAERISAPRFEALRVGGPDSDAGIGDYALQNGTLCAAVAAVDHETALSPQGGTLIDLGHCGANDDQWVTLHPLLNLARERLLPLDSVRAERDAREARVISEGVRDGIRARITYALDLAEPSALRVRTEIAREKDGRRIFAYAEAALHASGQMRSFHLYRPNLARSRGFSHPGTDPDSILSMLNTIVEDDVHVLVGGEELPPLAYGIETKGAWLVRTDGSRNELPRFSATGEDFTMMGVLGRPYFLGGSDGGPGYLELAQIPFLSVDEGERLELERTIHVASRADVAAIANTLLPGAVPVRGRVNDPSARLHFARADGAPISEVRPNADGSFALALPPGAYRLEAWGAEGRRVEREIAVGAAGAELAPVELESLAQLALPTGKTMRLVFVAQDGKPDPNFSDDLLGFRLGTGKLRPGTVSNVISLAAAETDPKSVALAPGRYRIYATRGPEFDVHETELTLTAGERQTLALDEPERGFKTPGWIGADLHVHSALSMDSALPLPEQLAAFAANGGEVVVNTEHDRLYDARPEIARLGLGDRIVSVVGVEVTGTFHGGETPHTIGHANAFPLRYEPDAYRGGAPVSEGRRLRALYAELRGRGDPFVQINHPRMRTPDEVGDGAYFSHLGLVGRPFDPTRPLAHERNRVLLEEDPTTGLRDLDFAGFEIANGKRLDRYRLARADWLSMLLQGKRSVATANSDSHSAGEIPALPRNYVEVPDDSIAGFDQATFLAALRAGKSFGTTGPLLFVDLAGVHPGGTLQGKQGVLRATVRAAPWVPVARVRVYVDAQLAGERAIGGGEAVELPLSLREGRLRGGGGERARRGPLRDATPGLYAAGLLEPDLRGRGRRWGVARARAPGSRPAAPRRPAGRLGARVG